MRSRSARLERLNWLGDTSAAGIRRSFGLMANYLYRLDLYRLDDLERNHESYARDHRVIASRAIEALAGRHAGWKASSRSCDL